MRALRAALLAAVMSGVAVLSSGALPAVADTGGITTQGGGFGHGVGLSQYGAYEMAKAGYTYDRILGHYYTGSAVSPTPDRVQIAVNLLRQVDQVYLRAESLGAGSQWSVAFAGRTPVTMGIADTVVVRPSSAGVVVLRNGVTLGAGASLSVAWSETPTVINLWGLGESATASGHRYRYGTLRLAPGGSGINAVASLSLHTQYLRGIAEVPASWPLSAIAAQVVAARSFALLKYRAGLRSDCSCHLTDTTADQVFAGWSAESGSYGAQLRKAVAASEDDAAGTGRVLTVAGKPVSAYYFSSSGGTTENNEDGFLGGTPTGYLRGVSDSWSRRVSNPYAHWSRSASASTAAALFGLPDVAWLDTTDRSPGGTVRSVVGYSSTGATARVSGDAFRTGLGLPSRWIRGWATRLSGADRYATAVAAGRAAVPSGATVVLATGEDGAMTDGMVAGSLAHARRAPLLLTPTASLAPVVEQEIRRRGATTAYLVGGTSSISQPVEDRLRQLGLTVTRYGGADRYDTAAQVAVAVSGSTLGGAAVIGSGDDASALDLLAAAAPAARVGRPVLLVRQGSVPAVTSAALTTLGTAAVSVIGTPTVISDAVLARLPRPARLSGTDHAGTATVVASAFAPLVAASTGGAVAVRSPVVVSTTGTLTPDLLSAGSLGRQVLFTGPTTVPTATSAWLQLHDTPHGIIGIGGIGVLPEATLLAISAGFQR
jgi:stage II sporulation protein D